MVKLQINPPNAQQRSAPLGLTFRFPTREASSEQFSAVLPLQLQKDK